MPKTSADHSSVAGVLTATVRWLEGAPADGASEHRWLAPLLSRALEPGAAEVAARPELRLLRAFPPIDASSEERR